MESVEHMGSAPPTGWAVARGFTAANGALTGALYLTLLHAPLQITNAISGSVQASTFAPGQEPDPGRVALAAALAGVTLLFGLVVFFAFPFVQGGILGQVRDRLERPKGPARAFWAHARAYYTRLLGSQALFLLVSLGVIVPVMILVAAAAIQATWAVSSAGESGPDRVNPQLLRHPFVLASMAMAMVLLTAAGIVYWMANCVVVAERGNTLAGWRRGFAFCRQNVAAVFMVWLVNLVVGVVLAPLGMLGQLGVVTSWWALAALALAYSAITGYWGVILAGLCMSLFLGRHLPAECAETPTLSAGIEP